MLIRGYFDAYSISERNTKMNQTEERIPSIQKVLTPEEAFDYLSENPGLCESILCSAGKHIQNPLACPRCDAVNYRLKTRKSRGPRIFYCRECSKQYSIATNLSFNWKQVPRTIVVALFDLSQSELNRLFGWSPKSVRGYQRILKRRSGCICKP